MLLEQGPLVVEQVRATAEHERPRLRELDGRGVDGAHECPVLGQLLDEVVERLAAHGEERMPTQSCGSGGCPLVVVDPLPRVGAGRI